MLKKLAKFSFVTGAAGYLPYAKLLSSYRAAYLSFIADDQVKSDFYGISHSLANSVRAGYAGDIVLYLIASNTL